MQSPAAFHGFELCCPACRAPLRQVGVDLLTCEHSSVCPVDGSTFPRVDGIWRCLLPAQQAYYARFMDEYARIRQLEGRGSDESAYYQALPFEDSRGNFASDWAIRAISYQALVKRVISGIPPEEEGLKVIDLGAGNCWLSYRLSRQGCRVAAVDLLTNPTDGLGAYLHYPVEFLKVQASFDDLPFLDHQAHLVVFNASLHYATDYERVLREALRMLLPGGLLVVMDTPIYRDPQSGARMAAERAEDFTRRFGFPSDSLSSEQFLTHERIQYVAQSLQIEWQWITPNYGWRWAIRPWIARLLRRREPAQFALLVARKLG